MKRLVRGLWWGLWVGLGTGAHASSCEEVKAGIAESMDATGLRGYSLQIVPAGTPLAGARVVGNCAGGARKIVYRRIALPQAQPHVSEAPPPTAPEPVPVAPAPAAPVARAAPAASIAVTPAAPASLATPAREPQPVAPVVAPVVALAPQPVPTPARAPEPVVAETKPAVAVAPASQAPAAQPSSSASLVPDLLMGHWPWLAGLLLLSLLVRLWRWRGPGLDAAGLPRGPRL